VNEFEALHYDEFGFLESYAQHEGIPWTGRPAVQRRTVEVGGGQHISALVWGEAEPELVLMHGIGQNAHTWDSVAMALGRPLVAVDLPGHGHSDWREDADYRPRTSAVAVAAALAQLAPAPRLVVGMSLGGLTLIRMAAEHPELVPRAVIVDITPGVGARVQAMTNDQRGVAALLGGPPTFESFEAMLAAAAAAQPGRPPESMRPGVLHNARQFPDGRWGWRYDGRRGGPPPAPGTPSRAETTAALWDDLESLRMPLMLVRGEKSFYIHDDDQAEFERRQPSARIEIVEGSGHSIQSDRAMYLAGLIGEFLDAPASA
jgi:pimeloyl-ACP methyl ester carboxylesterase